MDTVSVGRSTPNDMPDKCSKTLHIPESNPINHTRRLLLNNHNENLECSPDLEHYRLVSKGIVLDFEITESGEKRGWIHFTFLDKKDNPKQIEDAIMVKEIRFDQKLNRLTFAKASASKERRKGNTGPLRLCVFDLCGFFLRVDLVFDEFATGCHGDLFAYYDGRNLR